MMTVQKKENVQSETRYKFRTIVKKITHVLTPLHVMNGHIMNDITVFPFFGNI